MADQQHGQEPEQGSGEQDGARRYPAQGDQQPPGAPARRKPKLGVIIFFVVVIVAAVLGFLYWFAHRNEIDTDDAFTDGHAITIAPRVSGNVLSLDVNDNQAVQTGQILIKIDPADYIAARDQAQGSLDAIEAQITSAKANLAITEQTQPAKLAQAQAMLTNEQANEIKARRDYVRFHSVDPAATTREDIDAATATERQAQANVASAAAQVAQADTVALDIRQAEAQIGQLKAQAIEARAQLAQAELNLSYTDVLAPQAGWITQRNVEMGNYVATGTTIFSIVAPEIWITANFKEDQLARMRPGDHVRIHVDAYPKLKLTGHVDSVQLGSGSKFSAFPAENATGNYVKIVQRVPVKIDIDHGLDPNVPLPLGISVEPTVDVK